MEHKIVMNLPWVILINFWKKINRCDNPKGNMLFWLNHLRICFKNSFWAKLASKTRNSVWPCIYKGQSSWIHIFFQEIFKIDQLNSERITQKPGITLIKFATLRNAAAPDFLASSHLQGMKGDRCAHSLDRKTVCSKKNKENIENKSHTDRENKNCKTNKRQLKIRFNCAPRMAW